MSRKQLLTGRLAAQLPKLVNEYAFTDTAIYYAQASPSDQLDEHGHTIETEIGTTISCNFVDEFQVSERERWKPIGDISNTVAEIRFFAPPVPQNGGKFKLTHKNGIELENQKVYEVVFLQNRGAFGWVCSLKLGEL